jgi:hypothetical protein
MQKTVYFPDAPDTSYEQINQAAKEAGVTFSTFLRTAALERIGRTTRNARKDKGRETR